MFRPRSRDRRRGSGAAFFPGATLDMGFASSQYLGATPSSLTVTRASDGYAESSEGVWSVFTSNAARITNRGLLVEEARTNSLRNNSMQGAVPGTPGTAPTNWGSSFNTGTGVTSSVIGTGTENGIDYIDFRLQGTHSVGALWTLRFEGTAAVAAATAQTWTNSCFLRIAAGTSTGVSTPLLGLDENTSGGVFVAGGTGAATLTGAVTRSSFTRLFSGGGTVAAALPFFRISIAGSTAIDITIRIGWPQLELGAFATSPIPTTTVAVARAADSINMTGGAFTPWFTSSAAATLFVEGLSTASVGVAGQFRNWASLDDGVLNEAHVIFESAAGRGLLEQTFDGAVGQTSISSGTVATNTVFKSAVAFALNDVGFTTNGTTATVDTSATMPLPTALRFGTAVGFTTVANGYIRRVAYFPSRLSNAELQSLTT